MQGTLDALSATIAVLDRDGVIVAVNGAWRRFARANGLGHRRAYLGENYLAVCEAATGRDAVFGWTAAAGLREVAGGRRRLFTLEYPCHSPTQERWFVLRATRFESDGRTWVVAAHEDITARKRAEAAHRAEERQRELLGEVGDRIRDALALVRATAVETLRHSASLEAFAPAFLSRLDALARIPTLLTAVDDEGGTVELRALVEQTLAPHLAADGRLRPSGPDVALRPKAARTLGLVLHELAANAAQHGALSMAGGRVELAWQTEDAPDGSRLVLDWMERDGPPVRQPERWGFGRTLIEQGAARDLGGTARLTFPPEGLRCRVELPLAVVA